MTRPSRRRAGCTSPRPNGTRSCSASRTASSTWTRTATCRRTRPASGGGSRSANRGRPLACRDRYCWFTAWYRPDRSVYPFTMSFRAPRPVLDSARFGRTPVLFLLGLAACCLIAIVALVLVVAQRGPAPTLVGLLLALLPVPLLVALILYVDRLEPEPRALLAGIFGAGAGIAVITALLGRALHTSMITTPDLEPHSSVAVAVSAGAAIGGALVPETLNGLVLLALLASRRTGIDGV